MYTVVLPEIKRSIHYLFLRRTSGGGHIYLLLDDDQLEQFKRIFPEIKEEYEKFEREHGRSGTIGYVIEEVPKEVHKFFAELRKYIDLDYRIVGDVIEVAVVPQRVGQFIGKRGYKIRAMEKHLGKKIRVSQGVYQKGAGKPYFVGYRDPTRAYIMTEGYVAPWEVGNDEDF